MASAWKVAGRVLVENNLLRRVQRRCARRTPVDDLADRAAGYAMPGVVVDGQDIERVHGAVVEAVARARAGDGPSLLEMKTYRYPRASRTDPARYRRRASSTAGGARTRRHPRAR